MSGSIHAEEAESGLQQAEHECDKVVPTGLVDMGAKDVGTRAESWGSCGKADDDNRGGPRQGPKEGGAIARIKNPYAKDVYEPAHEGLGNVEDEDMPGLFFVFWMTECDDVDDESSPRLDVVATPKTHPPAKNQPLA